MTQFQNVLKPQFTEASNRNRFRKVKKKKSKENKQKTYGGKIGVCGLCACFFEVEGKRANPGPGGEGVMPSGPAAGPGEHPHGVPSPPRAAQGT